MATEDKKIGKYMVVKNETTVTPDLYKDLIRYKDLKDTSLNYSVNGEALQYSNIIVKKIGDAYKEYYVINGEEIAIDDYNEFIVPDSFTKFGIGKTSARIYDENTKGIIKLGTKPQFTSIKSTEPVPTPDYSIEGPAASSFYSRYYYYKLVPGETELNLFLYNDPDFSELIRLDKTIYLLDNYKNKVRPKYVAILLQAAGGSGITDLSKFDVEKVYYNDVGGGGSGGLFFAIIDTSVPWFIRLGSPAYAKDYIYDSTKIPISFDSAICTSKNFIASTDKSLVICGAGENGYNGYLPNNAIGGNGGTVTVYDNIDKFYCKKTIDGVSGGSCSRGQSTSINEISLSNINSSYNKFSTTFYSGGLKGADESGSITYYGGSGGGSSIFGNGGKGGNGSSNIGGSGEDASKYGAGGGGAGEGELSNETNGNGGKACLMFWWNSAFYQIISEQLKTPIIDEVGDSTVILESVDNATSYEVFIDDTSIGEHKV